MDQKIQLLEHFKHMSLQDKIDKILVYVDWLRQANENFLWLYTLLLEYKATITDEECDNIYSAIMDIVYHNTTVDQLSELVTQIAQKK